MEGAGRCVHACLVLVLGAYVLSTSNLAGMEDEDE